MKAIKSLHIPPIIIYAHTRKCIEGFAGSTDQIAFPRKKGIVGIALDYDATGRTPRDAAIESVFILDGRSFAETARMEGCIAAVIIAVQDHETQLVSCAIAQHMKGCQSTIGIDGGLTGKRQAGIGIAIVGAGIEEGSALKGIAAVRGILLQGAEGAIEMGIDSINIQEGLPFARTGTEERRTPRSELNRTCCR